MLSLTNPAAAAGFKPGYDGQWTEWKVAQRAIGGSILGEYCYYYPSYGDASYPGQLHRLVTQLAEVRLDTLDLVVGWIRMGSYENNSGIPLDRSQKNGLGLMLACLYPGNLNQSFLPCQIGGQVDYQETRSNVPSFIADTIALWNDMFGKYWGYPSTTRSWATTGTDPVGQFYYVEKFFLYEDAALTTPLTYVCGRYARGFNYDSTTTRISTALPAGGPWYELIGTGRARGVNNVYWKTTPKNEGDTAWLSNAYFRVFSADTVMSNTYVMGSTPIDPPTTGSRSPLTLSGAITLEGKIVIDTLIPTDDVPAP